jgi:squalene-hopene/tetraprenyl-beta-curcumene cyclase
MTDLRQQVREALAAAQESLLADFDETGFWRGELSGSALATATAVTALAAADGRAHQALVEGGLAWLARNVNADGGWGDTTDSPSNLSTTVLAWSAFAAAGREGPFAALLGRARDWIARAAGGLAPADLAAAVAGRYGQDRTFSAPILAMAALAGRLGPPEQAWALVPPLPFELAALPHRLLKWAGLPVVSYALPALIAVGQLIHHHRPTRCCAAGLLRRLTAGATLNLHSTPMRQPPRVKKRSSSAPV